MPRTATRRRALAAALACAAMLSACTGNSDDTGAPGTPAVAPDAAQTTATAAVSAAATSSLDASAAGAAARDKAFVGAALESANAYAKSLPGRTTAEKADAEARDHRRQGPRRSRAAATARSRCSRRRR